MEIMNDEILMSLFYYKNKIYMINEAKDENVLEYCWMWFNCDPQ